MLFQRLTFKVCRILLLSVLVCSGVLLVSRLVSTHLVGEQSPFECGLSRHKLARVPFSLRFFLLCIIFIIFDVEILLLVPVVWYSHGPISLFASSLYIFICILGVGLYHEWSEGSLAWIKL